MKTAAKPRTRRISTSAAVLAVVVAGVCAAWAIGAWGSGAAASAVRGALARAVGADDEAWVAGYLRSGVTVRAGAALLASVAALWLLCGAMWNLGRRRRHARGAGEGESGTAAIEFVLVFPLVLCVVLIMVQSTLLAAGNLAVHHAAYVAARSAMVWVPEKLSYDEPRNVVAPPEISAKVQRIRSAAVYAVMPVSAGKRGAGGSGAAGDAGDPGVIQDGFDRIHRAYGQTPPNWINTMLSSKYQYARQFTEVTLSPPADGEKYADHEDLKVQVRHQLYLGIPFANRIFGDALPGGRGDYATQVVVSYALTNQGVEDEIDVEVFPRRVDRGEW